MPQRFGVWVFLAIALFLSEVAWGRAPIEPQNRVHVGASMSTGTIPVGVTAGFDSRLTRVIAMDIGGWVSPAPIPLGVSKDDQTFGSYHQLRHGLYFLPGARIPHPQPKTFTWDVFFRAGGGVVWFANTAPDQASFRTSNHLVSPGPSAIAGLDLQFRVKSIGVRASGRAVGFSAPAFELYDGQFLVRPWGALEAFYQW